MGPQTKSETLRSGAAWSLATQLATALGTAVLTLYLVHSLGPTGYGILALAISIGGLVLEPSDFGISVATARLVAIHRDDPRQVAIDMGEGIRMKFVVSGLIAVALAALAGPIANVYGQPALVWPLRFIALTVFMQGILGFYRGMAGSLRRQSLGFRMVASESAAETVASIALVAVGLGAAGAAAGRAAGYVVGALVAMALTARVVGPHVLRRGASGSRAVRRSIAQYARSLFALDLAYATGAQLAPLLIGAFFNAASVAFFSAPSRFIIFLGYPGLAVANALAPRVAREEGETAELSQLELSVRRMIVFQGLLLPPLIAWADPIVHLLLGGAFAESADIVRALVPSVLFAGLVPIVTLSMSYLGHARARLRISLVSIALTVVLLLTLLPTIGLIGAAIAADIDMAYLVLAHMWFLHRRVGFRARSSILSAVRVLPAVVGATLVLAALGTSTTLPPAIWIAGGIAYPLVYAGILVATGELSVGDMRSVVRSVVSRLPRRGR